jgi:hypothetical protein
VWRTGLTARLEFSNGASFTLIRTLGSLDDADNVRIDAKSALT